MPRSNSSPTKPVTLQPQVPAIPDLPPGLIDTDVVPETMRGVQPPDGFQFSLPAAGEEVHVILAAKINHAREARWNAIAGRWEFLIEIEDFHQDVWIFKNPAGLWEQLPNVSPSAQPAL